MAERPEPMPLFDVHQLMDNEPTPSFEFYTGPKLLHNPGLNEHSVGKRDGHDPLDPEPTKQRRSNPHVHQGGVDRWHE
jgi:hypothetical protein